MQNLLPFHSDAYMLDWESQREPTPRAVLPRSFSAPYPPLEGIAEGTEEEEEEDDEEDDDEDGALWSEGQVENGEPVDGHEMSPTAEEDLVPTVMADEDLTGEVEQETGEEVDEGPTAEDIEQAMRVEAYILGLLQRCSLNAPDSTSPGLSCTSNHWQDLHAYPPSAPNYCDPTSGHSEWQEWAEEDGGEETQEGYYVPLLEAEVGPSSLVCEEPSLDVEQYRDVEPCTSASDADSLHHQRGYPVTSARYVYSHVSPPVTPKATDQDWAPRSHRVHQEERWGLDAERCRKTTIRSQSERSFPSQEWTGQPEHRYYTVGRERVDEEYVSCQRLWSSSADLSQEEEEPALRGEEPRLRFTSLPFHTSPQVCAQYTEQGQPLRNGKNAGATQAEGSDSSLSETCSPRSSSLSSDSDESGGLVWPQQLPPRLPSSSQNTPSAVVKIKASHALKRKIMRFRSGSLKVMTTV